MSWSKVQISNMALAKAGSSQAIAALEFAEGANVPNEARLCLLYWDLAFEAAARSHNWNCLTKRADISGNLTVSPAWGYAYAYQLPADYLGWLTLEDRAVEYKKVGRTIHTDETTITIEYVARTEDTDLFDPLFVEALVYRLAAHLVPALQGENALAKEQELRLWHERVTLPEARFADSAESGSEEIEDTTWRDSRY